MASCLVCDGQCPVGELEETSILPKEKGFSKESSADVCCNPVMNELQVFFFLRKVLEIPDKMCSNFLEDYGSPCSWINCCSTCTMYVNDAKRIYEQQVLLRKQFVKVQTEVKTKIVGLLKSKQYGRNTGRKSRKGAKEIIRSHIQQLYRYSGTQMVKQELSLDSDEEYMSIPLSPTDCAVTVNYSTESNYSVNLELNNDLDERDELNDSFSLEYSGAEDNDNDIKLYNPQEEDETNSSLEHMESLEDEDAKCCSICNKNFSSVLKLRRHQQVHRRKKNHSCETCGKAFRDTHDLTRHVRTHTGDRPFSCSSCEKTFLRKSELADHEKIHTGNLPHKCDTCGKCFVNARKLRSHAVIHSEEKRRDCPTCGKNVSLQSFERHIISHTGVRPYKCDICTKGFTKPSHLKDHIRIHTGEKPFKCDICSKTFGHSSHLKDHSRTHTGERPYVCEICGKDFSQAQHLKIHANIHSGEKPYKCTTCQKSFGDSSTLKQHIRVHTGEKPYQCGICGKNFSQCQHLKEHTKTHIKELPVKKILNPP